MNNLGSEDSFEGTDNSNCGEYNNISTSIESKRPLDINDSNISNGQDAKLIKPNHSLTSATAKDTQILNDGNGSSSNNNQDEIDDLFSDFSIEDISLLELEAPLPPNLPSAPDLDSGAYLRLTVIEVIYDQYIVQNNGSSYWNPQIKLVALHQISREGYVIYLRDSWRASIVDIGDTINVIGIFNQQNECIVNERENFVIIQSDQLINSTQLASSYSCLRMSVLQNRSLIVGSYSKPLILGSLLHELLESCLMNKDFSDEFMDPVIQGLIELNCDKLYSADVTEETILKDITEAKDKMQIWARRYITDNIQPVKFSKQSHKYANPADEPDGFAITATKSAEEMIMSPKFGIKGKVDLIVEFLLRYSNSNSIKRKLVPLEFKTGKVGFNLNYEIQTMLYQCLLSEKYQYSAELGVIFILNAEESQQLVKIHNTRERLVGIIQARNRLAAHLGDRDLSLPLLIHNRHICSRCDQLPACMVHHKTYENGNSSTVQGVEALYDQITSHLTPSQLDFYKKWNEFLNVEEKAIKIYKKEIWSKNSKELELKGKCFSEMILVNFSDNAELVNVIEFRKLAQDPNLSKLSNLPHSQATSQLPSQPIPGRDPLPSTSIQVGDPVIVSTESGIFGIAIGFVLEITKTSVKLTLSKEFRPPLKKCTTFEDQYNQKFLKFEDYTDFIQSTNVSFTRDELFRIDKDELAQGLKLLRGNLVRLMTDMSEHAILLRELIVNLRPPKLYKFKHGLDNTNRLPFNSHGQLNSDQELACEAAINNEDYTLILGMPGTGKTTTIAHLIKYLVEQQNQTVLITSYTHSSLDNILFKLIELNVTQFIRLGSLNKVHPDIRKYCVNHPDNATKSVNQAEAIYGKSPIVATTCLGMNHFLFDKRRFHYAVIDEASQLTLPTSLAPLIVSDRFILVGDHYQLPPLVRDEIQQADSAKTSLFKLLAEAHPDAVTRIRYQYRMNADIMALSNQLIYSHALQCGNDTVANAFLNIPNPNWLKTIHNSSNSTQMNSTCDFGSTCWLNHCLNPSNKVIFLNTDPIEQYENRQGELIHNPLEIDLIDQLVTCFTQSGVPLHQIGVLSPYRCQTNLLTSRFQHIPELDVMTIDQSQGRDKDCMIISLVRSNTLKLVGNLLKDWKRINVALTRSKKKLILIGSKSTLNQGTYLFQELIGTLQNRGKVFDMSATAHTQHTTIESLTSNALDSQNTPSRSRNTSVREVLVKNNDLFHDIFNESN